MSEFILNRNYTLISRTGHAVMFKKGEPTYVPAPVRAEAIGIGAVPVDGDTNVLPEEQVVVELTPEERREQLIKAFKTLQERDLRGDFTGQGFPSITALKKLVEFDPDKKEVETLYVQFREEQAAE